MASRPLSILALVFPGFELLDLFGPLELYGLLEERASIRLVAQAPGPVASTQGPRTIADIAFSDVQPYDVLLVPGGIGTRRLIGDAAFLASLRELAGKASYVTSVCTGSLLLGKAGLLDGRRATSNKLVFDLVASHGPAVHWVRQARWVEDGTYFTSSGVSAGMDMSLAVIQRLFDRETALTIARHAEYTWHEDSTVDPFATT